MSKLNFSAFPEKKFMGELDYCKSHSSERKWSVFHFRSIKNISSQVCRKWWDFHNRGLRDKQTQFPQSVCRTQMVKYWNHTCDSSTRVCDPRESILSLSSVHNQSVILKIWNPKVIFPLLIGVLSSLSFVSFGQFLSNSQIPFRRKSTTNGLQRTRDQITCKLYCNLFVKGKNRDFVNRTFVPYVLVCW